MDPAPRVDAYDWRGGREAMLRWGPEEGPRVVIALPLFEEANRCRAFAASICRALAGLGVGSILPDLPGQGESALSTATMRLAELRAAFAAASGDHGIAIRSGALVVDDRPCWLLSPQTGAELLRELARIKGDQTEGELVTIAGNQIGRDFLADLATATHPGAGRGLISMSEAGQPFSTDTSQLGRGLRRGGSEASRTVRLTSDARKADRHVDRPALWRRAEPDTDPVLAQTLATDIADWIARCGS